MDKKKSLGHNPLAYSLRNHASFDFIRDTNTANSGDEPVSSSGPDKSPAKKVVSYYLEENIIDRIKEIADKDDESYSHVVSEILRTALQKLDSREG